MAATSSAVLHVVRLWVLALVLLGANGAAAQSAVTKTVEPSPMSTTAEPSRAPVLVELFVRDGCARCSQAEDLVRELSLTRPYLRTKQYPVDHDEAARSELERRLRGAGIGVGGVPVIVVGGHVLVGFDEARAHQLRNLVDAPQSPLPATDSPAGTCPWDSEECTPADAPATAPADFEVFGRFSVAEHGLVVFTLALGLLDGFNPCAMWVLLFLLAMLAGQRDRKRMALTAGTFVVASGVVYYAFMAAWLNVFLLVGVSRTIQVVLGGVAVVIGLVNVKDFVAFGTGVSFSIPEAAKPGIYARVRKVLHTERLAASMLGVAVLAVLVNFVELLCTSGFPAIYTSVLARHDLSTIERAAYLGLYNLAYIVDDAVMVTIAVATLSRKRLTEVGGLWLKLVSGIVMVTLGVVLLVHPQWLI